ncbi:MAG: hypothetical protein F4Y71_03135 [Acidobacteria bacterium]|nr:hypothetical protein [Acidobacteriota bacterium]MXX85431.1 hypothetical protein [Acidobacteriota bacterium]MYE42831.1 hypothetical protein [Acidobacteriota bacterium]MYG76354.1 hypothetical protein [Acidobacteriota bacterium]
MRATFTLLLIVSAALPATGQTRPPGQNWGESERWAAFEFFAGEWVGEETATFGEGRGERTYELVLQDAYLLSRNRSVFPPHDGLPEGDVHDDWTVMSFDRDRDTYVLRQFNSEGYVNTFVLDAASSPPERMIFVLEESENARGTRATLTLTQIDANAFEEVFDLTLPGATESITIRSRWTRSIP